MNTETAACVHACTNIQNTHIYTPAPAPCSCPAPQSSLFRVPSRKRPILVMEDSERLTLMLWACRGTHVQRHCTTTQSTLAEGQHNSQPYKSCVQFSVFHSNSSSCSETKWHHSHHSCFLFESFLGICTFILSKGPHNWSSFRAWVYHPPFCLLLGQ
jgi:hypothetical protein